VRSRGGGSAQSTADSSDALARLYRQIESGRHTDAGFGLRDPDRMGVLNKEKTAVRDSYASNVEQFLNRIMVLHVEEQNRIFELFHERYQEAVEAAKRQGAFDFGMEDIRARNLRRVAEAETLFVDPASGARTMLHELEGEVDVVRYTFAAAAVRIQDGGLKRLGAVAGLGHVQFDRALAGGHPPPVVTVAVGGLLPPATFVPAPANELLDLGFHGLL